MLKELQKHKLAYLVLILGLIAGVILFLGAWPNRNLQQKIAIGLAVFYVLWGVTTHLKTKRVNRQVVLEYLSVGVLAGLLLILITL